MSTAPPKTVSFGRVTAVAVGVLGVMILVSLAWVRFAPVKWKYASHRRCGDRVVAYVEAFEREQGKAPETRDEIPIECRGGAVKYELRGGDWEVFLFSGVERIATYDRNARSWRFEQRGSL